MKSEVPSATVVITTKNRKDDLRLAISSCLEQSVCPEVIVVDDGSTDGTREMVASEFPDVRLDSHNNSTGYIPRRNRGAELAKGKYIFSIDDDAIFSSPTVVETTVEELDQEELAGAIAIPCIDVKKSPDVRQPFPSDGRKYAVSDYIGTAHAIRKDLFLRLSGYRCELIHQGEERDLGIRMLNAGYCVLLGSSDPIHHFESPKRDTRRMDHYGRRNDVLFAWQNVPSSRLPMHLIGTSLNGAKFGIKCGRPLKMMKGLAAGWLSMIGTARSPIRIGAYELFRDLRNRGSIALTEIEKRLTEFRAEFESESA